MGCNEVDLEKEIADFQRDVLGVRDWTADRVEDIMIAGAVGLGAGAVTSATAVSRGHSFKSTLAPATVTGVGAGAFYDNAFGDTTGSDGNDTGDDCTEGNISNPNPTPLVIDLDGDGIELISLGASTALFDLDVNGYAENTGWVSTDDGLLAYDRNGNGRIDDNTELFGDGAGHSDGFAHLSELDTNGDGVINSADAAFSDLLIWQDSDSDGRSEEGELSGLANHGIAEINLAAQEVDEINEGHLSLPN